MKALILKEYNHFIYDDITVPEIDENEVLIKIKACGICGSDVHGMDGSTGRRIPPVIMGHEASGIIEKTGKSVSGWNTGDRVTFDSTIYCGKCSYCKEGKINLCSNRKVLGVSCSEYRQNGAFAEYAAVPSHILYQLPDKISFEHAAMVEALSIAFHAVRRTPIKLNDTAVVVGTGMIGLLVIQSLRLAGCGNIIAIDIDDMKLKQAQNFGANFCFNSTKINVNEEILKLTRNEGADIAFEAVGITSTVNTAINSIKKGGSVTFVGNLSAQIDFPLQYVVTREITIYGSCASSGEYDACLEMIANGKIDVDSLISKVAPLSEGAIWFDKLYNKEPGLMKVILIP
jgi:L-iditol 2-dehydrogenase